MVRIVGLPIALAVAMLGPKVAYADYSVAVLGVQPVDVSSKLANAFSKELEGLVTQTAGYTLVPGKSLAEIQLIFGCVDETIACMVRVGQSLNADKLVWGELKKEKKAFHLNIRVLNVVRGEMENSLDQGFGAEEVTDPGKIILGLARALLLPIRGQIKLVCGEEGAKVFLEKQLVGTTDGSPLIVKDLPVGQQVIQVEKEGYFSWVQQIQVTGGETVEVKVELKAVPVEPPEKMPIPAPILEPKPDTRRSWKIVFWTSAVLAVGSTVGAIVGGVSVKQAEQDKVDEIRNITIKYGENGNYATVIPSLNDKSKDVCSIVWVQQDYAGLSELNSICNKGKSRAAMTTGFIIGAAATAIISVFSVFKAYVHDSEEANSISESARLRGPAVRWQLLPSVSPDGVNLGFSLSFW
ncbi:MAG: PEGA domain-containing protein [Pseudomonadota bacterium]